MLVERGVRHEAGVEERAQQAQHDQRHVGARRELTARDPGFGIRSWHGGADDLARVGRDYRAAMQQRYGGDLAKMWAAYNWGPGNLDRAIAAHGGNWLSAVPAETRDYIRRNMRAVENR